MCFREPIEVHSKCVCCPEAFISLNVRELLFSENFAVVFSMFRSAPFHPILSRWCICCRLNHQCYMCALRSGVHAKRLLFYSGQIFSSIFLQTLATFSTRHLDNFLPTGMMYAIFSLESILSSFLKYQMYTLIIFSLYSSLLVVFYRWSLLWMLGATSTSSWGALEDFN